MIQIYDYELSSSCYKVRLMMNLLKLEYEVIPVGFYPAAEHRAADFLAINPLGQLPVIQDGQHRLRDSQAILVYLASKFDSLKKWYPSDSVTMSNVNMWLSFAGGELMNASSARLHDLIRYPGDISALRSAAHQAFEVLDDHLAEAEITGQNWLAAEHATIADIACFPCTALSHDGGISRDQYPAIDRWLGRVMRLPGFVGMSGIQEPWQNSQLASV